MILEQSILLEVESLNLKTLNYLHYFFYIPQKLVFCDLLPDSGRAHHQEGSEGLEIPSIIKYKVYFMEALYEDFK